MDKETVKMVKGILRSVVSAKDKKTTKEIYHKVGGKQIVEARYCRQYCLRDTPEVRQAIKEFLG